ncbi:MAG: oligosaccharide flippase family protein [Pseudoprimorskyibacter sp.]|nr:oligosaccharide flippase family protein [Pseudoprimorskyibacter sp.]
MIARLQSLMQSSFLRAVAVLSGGQAVAILVPILVAPILGRLYVPADYGALAAYMAPAAILAMLASLQFQHAIIAERTDHNAALVGWICIIGSLTISGLSALAVALLWNSVLMQTATGAWFILLPVTLAGTGLVTAGQFQANRHRYYRWIAALQIIVMVTTVTLSILLGVLGWGANGLLTSYFLSQLIQILGFGCLLVWGKTALPHPSLRRLRMLIRRHWKFPAFTLPSEFLGQMNMQLPVLALTAVGADATLGAFTRARQLVSMPFTVMGHSVGQVFRREGSELYRRTGSCRRLMLKTAGGMFSICLVPCVIFLIFAPWLAVFYLGPDWREAGELSRILAPMLLMRATSSPVSNVYFFTENQLLNLFLLIVFTVVMGAAFLAIFMLGGSAHLMIYTFSAVYFGFYVVQFLIGLMIAGPLK